MSRNFLRGMGSGMNLFPEDRTLDYSLPSYSDQEAFQKDLEQVGADMRNAIKVIDANFNKKDLEKMEKF